MIVLQRMLCCLALALVVSPGRVQARDYVFDTVHSRVSFEVSHLDFSMALGTFRGLTGEFSFDAGDWQKARCDVRIDVASLDMGDAAWRKTLLGKSWFHVEKYPDMHFVCTQLEQTSERRGVLKGNLTLLGVTRPFSLDLSFNRAGMHKFALQYVAGFSARAELKRSEFGMTRNIPDIGDRIQIQIEVEATRSKR